MRMSLPLAAGALLFGTSPFRPGPSDAETARFTRLRSSKDSFAVDLGVEALKAAVLTNCRAGLHRGGGLCLVQSRRPRISRRQTTRVKPVCLTAVTWDDDKTKIEAEPIATGVGGPDEGIEKSTASLDLTPRIASHDYPACSPGPGDDNCIQLYEPGVRTALASWNGETGGLLDPSAGTAMGGPLEEVDDTGVKTATADASIGTGGPVRETGYPPCSGSESDDRCIQLYEPGVTGAGN